ncbi:TPA: hypothetical protein HA235_01995 [Candidatus Woesearchaeota archaeon]|nr:hypothetical protein [Candidatus Woesearchaeota archaeon]HIH31455.1 hypothetical protein [Candidatus Woesearchaeota archaeon]HIH54239.1 hypothetical protein [Candidatus Woesearchaeota archaeon]HIJ02624.1 hypothetical protein [Candidatus Woesearchaeota archaeon]HIJ14554.1 hypothetical protein [Candidatus Woesearchaeota archaeon]
MNNAPYEQEFVFHNGSRAKNIFELSVFLENMPDNEFRSFVNEQKNDFANWIEYVLEEKDLAIKLRATINIHETRNILKKFIEPPEKKSIIAVESEKKIIQPFESMIKKTVSVHDNKVEQLQHESYHSEHYKQGHHDSIEDHKEEHHHEQGKEHKKEPFKKFITEDMSSLVWLILYGLIIGLIVLLLIYKFVYKG